MTDDSPANGPGSGTNSARAVSEPGTKLSRGYVWLLRNGLYVEAGIAVTAIVVGTIALPFLVFGTFVALGGEGSILAGGAIIAVICTALLLCLAVLLLVHGYLEATNHRVPFTGDGDARTLAVDGIRTTEMIAAGVFICGLAAALVLVAVRGEIPTALPFIVIVAAIAQSVAVLIHATGRAVSYLLRDG